MSVMHVSLYVYIYIYVYIYRRIIVIHYLQCIIYLKLYVHTYGTNPVQWPLS